MIIRYSAHSSVIDAEKKGKNNQYTSPDLGPSIGRSIYLRTDIWNWNIYKLIKIQ